MGVDQHHRRPLAADPVGQIDAIDLEPLQAVAAVLLFQLRHRNIAVTEPQVGDSERDEEDNRQQPSCYPAQHGPQHQSPL